MPLKFRLELEVVLDDDSKAKVIELARNCYTRSGGASGLDDPEPTRILSGEEFIEEIEQALMELLEHNPLLSQAGVEVESLGCKSEVPRSEVVALSNDSTPSDRRAETEQDIEEAELDDFESGLYVCRWPNGDFSVVKADSKREAILQLDEWAGAEPAWLVPLDTCMIDFRLSDEAEIELAQFGDETGEFIWDQCYPALDKVLSSDGGYGSGARGRDTRTAQRIRKAVEHERRRLWSVQQNGVPAKTALGRELQKRLGTVGPVADHYVGLASEIILQGKAGEKGKPN